MKRHRPVPLALAVLAAGIAAVAVAQAPPERSPVYREYCQVCHGPDGKANTEEGKKKGARDFTNAKWQASVSDERLARSIRRGREKMPAWGSKLNDGQIKALVKEVRSLGGRG